MKHCFAVLLAVTLTYVLSCKKSNSGEIITYEVKVTSGTWSGDYFDYSGSTTALRMVNNQPSGWKYSFTITHGRQADLVLSAIPDNVNGSTMAIANIYQGGILIATDSSFFGANAQIIINQ